MPQSKIYFICQNPDCNDAAHEVPDPLAAVVLSSLGQVVFNLSGDIDEMSDKDIRKEMEEQADRAREAGVLEYADHITAFIKDYLEPVAKCEEAKGTDDECNISMGQASGMSMYSTEEYNQIQLEAMRVQNEATKAAAAKALAEARLINAQAEQLEMKIPPRHRNTESHTH